MKNVLITIFCLFVVFTNYAQCNEAIHSNNPSDNWQSCNTKESPNALRANAHWVMYDLGYIYPITSSYIWNYNVSGATNKGFKDVVVDYSVDGETWVELGSYTFSEASGSNLYTGFEGPDFGDIETRYVLITAINNYGNTCFGLAECKFNIGEDVTIGIKEITDKLNLKVFPSPTNKTIQISYEDMDVQEIVIRTAKGTEVIRYVDDIPKMFDVSWLASGVYFVIVKTKNNEFAVRKFVKVNN